MTEIEITNNWIDRYCDDDLNEIEKQLFRSNLGRNSLLRKEFLVEARLNRFMEDKDTIELMKKIQNIASKPYLKIRRFILYMAAASFLCLVAFGVAYYLMRSNPATMIRVSEKNVKSAQDKRSGIPLSTNRIREEWIIENITPVTRRELAARTVSSEYYKPMLEYELLVGAVTRTPSVRVVSPPSEVKTRLNFPIQFKWAADNNTVPVNISIINNHGKTIFTSPAIVQSQTYILETSQLGIGLFYWKLLFDDEIIMMGKIITF